MNGVLEQVLIALQEICIERKMIDLTQLAIDAFFFYRKGGGEQADHSYKGKGVITHLLVDGLGQPLAATSSGASGDERREVIPLLKKISGWLKPIVAQGVTPIGKEGSNTGRAFWDLAFCFIEYGNWSSGGGG